MATLELLGSYTKVKLKRLSSERCFLFLCYLFLFSKLFKNGEHPKFLSEQYDFAHFFFCFFFFFKGKRYHILPDEFSKHAEQGELSFHLKGHASFNP